MAASSHHDRVDRSPCARVIVPHGRRRKTVDHGQDTGASGLTLRRRAIVAFAFLGCAAMMWPLAGHAQQSERVRRVGALVPLRENDPTTQRFSTAFAQSMERFGWVPGKNIQI